MIETIEVVATGEAAPVVVVAVVTVVVEDLEEAAVEADLMMITVETIEEIEIVLVGEIVVADSIMIEASIGIMHHEVVAVVVAEVATLAVIGQTMDVIMITMIITTETIIKAHGPQHHHHVVVIKEVVVVMVINKTTNKITHGTIINQIIVVVEAHGVMPIKVEVLMITMIDHRDTLAIVIVAVVVVVIVVAMEVTVVLVVDVEAMVDIEVRVLIT